MRRKICTFGAVCALLLTACGKGNAVVQTSSGAGQASNMEQVPEGMPARPERTESQTITVAGKGCRGLSEGEYRKSESASGGA